MYCTESSDSVPHRNQVCGNEQWHPVHGSEREQLLSIAGFKITTVAINQSSQLHRYNLLRSMWSLSTRRFMVSEACCPVSSVR